MVNTKKKPTAICEYCKEPFAYTRRGADAPTPRYCSRPCMFAWRVANPPASMKGARGLTDPPTATEQECRECHAIKPIEAYSRFYVKRVDRWYYQRVCQDCKAMHARNRRKSPDRAMRPARAQWLDPATGCFVKACSQCGMVKPVGEFRPSENSLRGPCRDCDNQAERERRQTHPEVFRATYRRYSEANREKLREKNRRYARENPATVRENCARRRARKKNAPVVELIDREAIIARDGCRCYLCGLVLDPAVKAPHSRSITLDHVVPLARGGAHAASNLRVACYLCNSRKGDRLLVELDWYKEF